MIKYQGISTLEVLVEAKNYNKWITDEILSHISSPVLEIGSGTGNITAYCLQKTPLYVTDNDSGLVKHLKKRFIGEKDVFISLLDITKTPSKKFKEFFSAIYAINVFEHIKDDEKAFSNIKSLLKPNGKLVLLVPAKRFAFTKLDKDLGHYRRYEKNEISEKLMRAGYQIEKIYFFNIVGLISWYFRDKVKSSDVQIKPYHIMMFDMIVPFLRFIESRIRPFVGISLIVVARKDNEKKKE